MKKLIALFVCFLFATSMLVATGCAKKEEPAKPAAAPEKKAEETKPGEAAKAPEPAKAPEKK